MDTKKLRERMDKLAKMDIRECYIELLSITRAALDRIEELETETASDVWVHVFGDESERGNGTLFTIKHHGETVPVWLDVWAEPVQKYKRVPVHGAPRVSEPEAQGVGEVWVGLPPECNEHILPDGDDGEHDHCDNMRVWSEYPNGDHCGLYLYRVPIHGALLQGEREREQAPPTVWIGRDTKNGPFVAGTTKEDLNTVNLWGPIKVTGAEKPQECEGCKQAADLGYDIVEVCNQLQITLARAEAAEAHAKKVEQNWKAQRNALHTRLLEMESWEKAPIRLPEKTPLCPVCGGCWPTLCGAGPPPCGCVNWDIPRMDWFIHCAVRSAPPQREGVEECEDMSTFNIADIIETVGLMRKRLESGQGELSSAMCRLSLPMSEALLARVNELRSTRDALKAEMEERKARDKELEKPIADQGEVWVRLPTRANGKTPALGAVAFAPPDHHQAEMDGRSGMEWYRFPVRGVPEQTGCCMECQGTGFSGNEVRHPCPSCAAGAVAARLQGEYAARLDEAREEFQAILYESMEMAIEYRKGVEAERDALKKELAELVARDRGCGDED